MNPLAFAVHVVTPTRSARGWTRGMPPPHSPRRVQAGVVRGARLTRVAQATLSESTRSHASTAQDASPASSGAQPHDEHATVESYLDADVDCAASASAGTGSVVDTLLARLGCDDGVPPSSPQPQPQPPVPSTSTPSSPHAPSAPRLRGDAISDARDQTLSVHGGERVRTVRKTKAMLDAIQIPIVQSATYTFRSTQDCIDYNRGQYSSFEYGRYGNPTSRTVEEKVMALEGAEDCLLSSSGMNAVTTMLLALVPENGHVVTTTDCYRRTRQFVSTVLPKMGITCTVLDPADLHGLQQVLESKHVSLYFSESPTNPLLRVVDIPQIVELCQKHDAISVFDTTFATAVNLRPVQFGADLVLHSGTKYLSGHQDVMSGVLAGRRTLVQRVRKLHGVLGGVIDPHAAYLINRGMKTLAVRMEAHNRNAEAVAHFLQAHPKVHRVHYPTVQNYRDRAVAQKLFPKGFGGVLSFELVGNGDPWSAPTFRSAGRFVDHLNIPYIGPSLGGCESIVEQVCIMGYFDQPLSERRRLGISNGLVRFSCGIEDTEDLILDIEQALRYA